MGNKMNFRYRQILLVVFVLNSCGSLPENREEEVECNSFSSTLCLLEGTRLNIKHESFSGGTLPISTCEERKPKNLGSERIQEVTCNSGGDNFAIAVGSVGEQEATCTSENVDFRFVISTKTAYLRTSNGEEKQMSCEYRLK